jgi:hypothetical protein
MKPVKMFRIFRGICFLHRLQNVQNVCYVSSGLLWKIIVSGKEEITGCWTEIFMICTHFQMLLAPLYQQKWRLEVGAAWIHLAHCRVQWSAFVNAGYIMCGASFNEVGKY